jgi:hypothetical protein
VEEERECDLSIFDIQTLSDIKKRPDILQRIKLDVTPRVVMEPRFQSRPEDVQQLRDISGYMFYIETHCNPPALMLMKVGKTDTTTTAGMIGEIPRELIERAIENPVHPPVFGMYPISEEIRSWLKGELAI